MTLKLIPVYRNGATQGTKSKTILSHCKNIKDIADIVIHGRWINPHYTSLEQAASIVRPLVEKIFDGSCLL